MLAEGREASGASAASPALCSLIRAGWSARWWCWWWCRYTELKQQLESDIGGPVQLRHRDATTGHVTTLGSDDDYEQLLREHAAVKTLTVRGTHGGGWVRDRQARTHTLCTPQQLQQLLTTRPVCIVCLPCLWSVLAGGQQPRRPSSRRCG